MKTTELYLEQVFIGFLIIAIGALPWVPDLWDNLKNVQTVVGVAGGSAALGLAFWLGIPFDRLADTLCDRLDRRNRLEFALSLQEKRALAQAKEEKRILARAKEKAPLAQTDDEKRTAAQAEEEKRKRAEADEDDPYPENLYLIACRKQSATIIRQWDYLRSRIRLSRALAAYGPALTLISTFAALHWKPGGDTIDLSVAGCWFGLVIAAYAMWTMLVLVSAKVPRTDKVDERNAYAEKRQKWTMKELRAWLAEWRTWLAPVLLIGISLIYGAKNREHPEVFLTAVGGTVLTTLSAWSWWRISTTYRDFLLDCWQFRDHTDAPKPHPASQPPAAAVSTAQTEGH